MFARVDRSGRIVKTKSDTERERKMLVQMDSKPLNFDTKLAVTHQVIDRALSNIRAEEEEFPSRPEIVIVLMTGIVFAQKSISWPDPLFLSNRR